jgi:NAD(P)-dependent dehydrogenase (short-subunit alcohol dehydrogenase family)
VRALVTGGSSGIGAATVRLLAAEGARVAAVARRTDALEELAGLDAESVLAVTADVSDEGQVRQAVQRTVEELGGLDAVVNCAGIVEPRALRELDTESWNRTLAVNLTGTFLVCREAGLFMASAQGGAIVNVGSDLAVRGAPLYAAYCASKAGVVGLTKALAVELAPDVRVNALCPGPVDTPMLDAEFALFPDPQRARTDALAQVPLRRFATPQEAAAAVLYLLRDATFATGATLELDGGTTAAY